MTCSIMVIDDSPSILEFMKVQLLTLGVRQVELFESPVKAIQELLDQPDQYDGVFVDLNMPDIDGMTLVSYLAESGYKGGVCIISALESRVVALAAQLAKQSNLYFIGSIPKPVNQQHLALAILKMQQSHLFRARSENWGDEEKTAALKQGHPVCYFQPQIKLPDNEVAGMECLIRLQLPNQKILGASEFVPFAEEHGFIDQLFKSMMPSVFQGIRYFREKGLKDLTCSLNLSPVQLEDETLPNYMEQLLEENRVPVSAIMLEVTESQILDEKKLATLNRLRIKGFELSLDDFGTGYTNFNQLLTLPFSEVKLDRDICNGIAENKTSALVVDSVVKIGKEQGFKVLAEGAESTKDIERLIELGVTLFQGFNISRPKPLSEIEKWMRAWESVINKNVSVKATS